MIRALQVALIGALLSLASLCGFGCWGIYAVVMSERQIELDSDKTVQAVAGTAVKIGAVADTVNETISQAKPQITLTLNRANVAIANLDQATAGLNTAISELNAPCADGKPCGTLADVNRTLNTIRLASGQVTAFSLKEQTQLDLANQQETAVAGLTEGDLTKLGTAIDGINELATNKDLTGSLKQTNVALGAVAGMATDTQQYWHSVLHPKLIKRVWNAVTGAGVNVAKFFF